MLLLFLDTDYLSHLHFFLQEFYNYSSIINYIISFLRAQANLLYVSDGTVSHEAVEKAQWVKHILSQHED